MSRRRTKFRNLLEVDLTVVVAVAAIIWATIGGVYGINVAFTVLAYGLMIVFMVGFPILAWKQRQANNNQMQNIRRKYGGQLNDGWVRLFTGRSLVFEYDCLLTRVVITYGGHGSDDADNKDFFRMTIDGLNRDSRLSVERTGVLSHLAELIGIQDVQLGCPRFDDTYVVKADDTATAQALLTSDVQHRILAFPDQRCLRITIGEGQLTVEAVFDSFMIEPLVLVDAVIQLYDGLRSGVTVV